MKLKIGTNNKETYFTNRVDYNVSFTNVSFEEMKTLMTVFEGLEEARKLEVVANEEDK
ncbi:hypothetical protein LL046_09270 [Lactococcus lactis subsp. lactis]|uniref:hypothetical protein n=1 Tax=Lactococcus lactis TaxID=1358 RepID=UPI001F11699F|nr:hypothetical protein [Lactococcus lactis]MCH5425295.1 hypothetical protein [Lactococcus lactis]